jgi:hypothetical protein
MKPRKEIMKLKSVMSTIGNGLLDGAAVMHNAPISARMRDIDAEIAQLQEEKAKLETQKI